MGGALVSEPGTQRESLPALFARFLRFGFLAWGGPVAQIAMIKRELVEEAKWLTPERFNRLLAVYQVLPGPEAHELCVHMGMMRRGRIGGLLAGLGFMLPGLVLIIALAWLYGQLDLDQPPFGALFLGIQIGVVALIVRAVHRIGEHILADGWLWAIAVVSGAASMGGTGFWIVLPASALVYLLAGTRHRWAIVVVVAAAAAVALLTLTQDGAPIVPEPAPSVVQATGVGMIALFWSGLKAGLLTFGGAYTAIPFVRGDSVERGWVSDGQFLDGLALSGMIPAPLIIFATFVGYLAGGLGGALAITAGIFLPAFGFTLLFFDRLEAVMDNSRLRRSLEGVAAGVVGLIAATTVELGSGVFRSAPSTSPALAIFAASLALLYAWRSKLNVLALIPLSGAAGAMAFA